MSTELFFPYLKRVIWGIAMSAVLTLVVVVGFGCGGGGGNGNKIAFVSERNGNAEIYVMNPDGSDQTRLTVNNAADSEPRWSPDRQIIAYLSEESGDQEINRVVFSKEDARPERLTNVPGLDEQHRWSPDGTRIAFISSYRGRPEIYLINSNGSGFAPVTFDSVGPSEPQLGSWSPDGQWIVYTLHPEGEGPGIFIRNPNGVNRNRLTTGKDYNPTWSPDGTKIVYTSMRDGNMEIVVMNSDSSDQVQLTNNDTADVQPTWSPDGQRIAFVSESDGDAEIYVMNVDGGHVSPLTRNQVKDDNPVWSPDGKNIAFVSYLFGAGEIFVMDSSGGNQKRLTKNSTEDYDPQW